jgi:hypothetical protein
VPDRGDELPGSSLAGIVQPASPACVSPLDAGNRFQHSPPAGKLRGARVRLDEFTRRATNVVSDRSGWTLRREPKYLLETFK